LAGGRILVSVHVIPEIRANTFLAGKGGRGQGDHVWVNFRLLCDCLTSLGSVLKITGVAQIYGLVFSTIPVVNYLGQKLAGQCMYILGDFFTNSSGHPGCGHGQYLPI
jgi:hypothetical protein